jgi:Cu2+-exporting ATPase
VPGEAIPADGLLLSESADVDESLLTGESKLLLKHKGDMLLAGSTLGPNACEMQVSDIGSNTQLSQILRLVQHAQNNKSIENIWAERIASRFVISMFAITLLAFAFWWQVDPSKAFSVALAVLVAACPCALSLAVPAAVSSAYDALASAGVLVLSAEALTKLNTIQHIIFDKTGTLTDGQASIKQIDLYAGINAQQAMQLAYSMELGCKHPLASAFKIPQHESLSFEDIQAVPGHGIRAKYLGEQYKLGKASFAAPDQPDNGIWLSRNEHIVARFIITDSIKSNASMVLEDLHKQAFICHILSGDSIEQVH